MKRIELVCHAFAVDHPHYAAFLSAQVRSLYQNPPSCDVHLLVAYTPDDARTARVLQNAMIRESVCGGAKVTAIAMPRETLFRRAIFRDQIARSTHADVVLFADCDYSYLDGCLDSICAQVQKDSGLCYPDAYQCMTSHAAGDAFATRVLAGGEPVIDPAQFTRRRSRLAIGGLQIVGGETARRIGYLPDSRWQRPVDPTRPFACFRDDSKWRRVNFPDGGRAITVPNLYRLRHSTGAEGSPGPGIAVDDKAPRAV